MKLAQIFRNIGCIILHVVCVCVRARLLARVYTKFWRHKYSMFNRLANQLEKRKWKYAYGRNLGATTCVCVRAYALECLLVCGSIPHDSFGAHPYGILFFVCTDNSCMELHRFSLPRYHRCRPHRFGFCVFNRFWHKALIKYTWQGKARQGNERRANKNRGDYRGTNISR